MAELRFSDPMLVLKPRPILAKRCLSRFLLRLGTDVPLIKQKPVKHRLYTKQGGPGSCIVLAFANK